LRAPVWRVGLGADADVRITELELDEHGSTARIEVPGGGSGRDHPFTLRLRVPGLHNVRNAAAALAVVYELGADIGRALAALAQSEEHTSELQSRGHLVCRLLLEKK